MTASDARPPSDTGTTGWHRHFEKGRHIFADDECGHSDRHMRGCKSCRPVLVVDPAEARGVIAHIIQMARIGAGSGELADQILAALTHPEGTS